jgi:hypothetical protein
MAVRTKQKQKIISAFIHFVLLINLNISLIIPSIATLISNKQYKLYSSLDYYSYKNTLFVCPEQSTQQFLPLKTNPISRTKKNCCEGKKKVLSYFDYT